MRLGYYFLELALRDLVVMRNKYISSFMLISIIFSMFLYITNISNQIDTFVQRTNAPTTSNSTSTTTTTTSSSTSTTNAPTTTTTILEIETTQDVDTYVTTTTTTSATSTTNAPTTTSAPTIIGISEDSKFVQIIDESIQESDVYEGLYTLFAGYEGSNQELLDNLRNDLPEQLKNIVDQKVIYINGCHEYAKKIVGRCPYGVWDSSGTHLNGTKGADWRLSIWVSNRAFDSGEANDVLIHEASHALSFLTRECKSENNSNYRKDAWDYFNGEEDFADALVLYFGGSYNHYRDSGPLSNEESLFINKYLIACED